MNAHAGQPIAAELVVEPIEVGAFVLNGRETIRARLDAFKGQRIINFRKWFEGTDGIDRPTKKGIAFSVRHLPEFAALANAALARAIAEGLLPKEGDDQ